MATKNHSKSMSTVERAFWREAFLNYKPPIAEWHDTVQYRADFADAAVRAYRERVTWRTP